MKGKQLFCLFSSLFHVSSENVPVRNILTCLTSLSILNTPHKYSALIPHHLAFSGHHKVDWIKGVLLFGPRETSPCGVGGVGLTVSTGVCRCWKPSKQTSPSPWLQWLIHLQSKASTRAMRVLPGIFLPKVWAETIISTLVAELAGSKVRISGGYFDAMPWEPEDEFW